MSCVNCCFPKCLCIWLFARPVIQVFYTSHSSVSLFRCAYFYAGGICNEAHKLCAGVGATEVVRSARHPSGRCPENRRLSPQTDRAAKTWQIPTRFSNIVLAHNPRLLLPLEGLRLRSGLVLNLPTVFSFSRICKHSKVCKAKASREYLTSIKFPATNKIFWSPLCCSLKNTNKIFWPALC